MSIYSIWLMPEKDSRANYRDIIIKLSTKLKSPPFDPHCTLYGRLDIDIDKIIPAVNDLVKSKNQFSTYVKRLKTGKTKWKSLYLALENKQEMQFLYEYCKNKFHASRKYVFDPHLSIAYGNFDPEKVHYATKSINIPKYLAFSGIAIVKTGENIVDWEIVFQRNFCSD